jgi:hypothetical protein
MTVAIKKQQYDHYDDEVETRAAIAGQGLAPFLR